MPAEGPGEPVWVSLGGNGLVSAWPCCRCSGHVDREAPHARCGGARPANGTFVAENRRQAATTTMIVMVHQWWSGGHVRSADAVRGSDQSGVRCGR